MVEDLINGIVSRCEPAVWDRISPSAFDMDPSQVRGYIRASAALIVDREVTTATLDMSEVTDFMIHRMKRGVADNLVRSTMARIAERHPSHLRPAA